jgi:hypothetical protein
MKALALGLLIILTGVSCAVNNGHTPLNRSSLGPPVPPRPAPALLVPGTVTTNCIQLAWCASSSANVLSYVMYYGMQPRAYVSSFQVGNVTNFNFQYVTDVVDTNTVIFSVPEDGQSYTNVWVLYFTLTASGAEGNSPYSNEVQWPPLPVNWNAVTISWGTNVCNMLLLESPDLAIWQLATNVIGTSVVVPINQPNLFFRGMTTSIPCPALQINGAIQ